MSQVAATTFPPAAESDLVQGLICPGCAHVDSLVEVVKVRPLDAGDLVGAWLFGPISLLLSLTGRTTRRIKCGRCGRRFARPAGLGAKLLRGVIVVSLVTLLFGAFGMFAAEEESTSSIGVLKWVSDTCTRLAASPLIAVAMTAGAIVATFMLVVVGHASEQRTRRHLYRALRRREQASIAGSSTTAIS